MDFDSEFQLLPGNIGQPVYINSGSFSGQYIRVELHELQQADLGRKYAKVDRRPLDPPPAILLRIFAVYDYGTDRQREQEVINYQDIKSIGMICTLDLFPVPESILDNRQLHQPRYPSAMTNMNSHLMDLQAQPLTFFPLYPYSTLEYPGTSHSPFYIPRRQSTLTQLTSQSLQDVVFRLGNHLVTESSKLTPALVGEKFVEPVLIDHMGRKSLIFVFSDLAVQREGTFIFRYRIFDIFSSITNRPILAEVFGGAFKVYSTREFPGLSPSTEFTKNLTKYGVRVTMRDSERGGVARSAYS